MGLVHLIDIFQVLHMMARGLVFLLMEIVKLKARNQNMGNEVTMKLPLNWYEDNDLLGSSLFSFHVPVDGFKEKAEDELKAENPPLCSLKCELSFRADQFGIVDDLFLDYFCGSCYKNGGVSFK